MISKFNRFRNPGTKDKHLLMLELAEVKDIADIIFKRLNRKIEVLESIEASVDEKIAMLDDLIKKAETLKVPCSGMDKHAEIVSLGRKGMNNREIADLLDIPVGEIELLLSLRGVRNANHN